MRSFLLSVVCAVAVMPVMAMAAANNKPERTPEELLLNDARWQCEELLRVTLDYPNRAKFEFFDNFPAQKLADGSFTVDATYQEEENGAKKKAQCSLIKSSVGEWQLKGVKPLP